MALEKYLWQRLVRANKQLRAAGFSVHACRLENSAGEGNPDVEACIEGNQIWIELKSCERPKRDTTMIRPRTRESQSIWHRQRSEAGSKHHWVLIQVGEAREALLYLIPGDRYDAITTTEAHLASMSQIAPDAPVAEVLIRATEGFG